MFLESLYGGSRRELADGLVPHSRHRIDSELNLGDRRPGSGHFYVAAQTCGRTTCTAWTTRSVTDTLTWSRDACHDEGCTASVK